IAQLPSQASERLFSLEFLKAISITAVVSFHAIFLPNSALNGSYEILETLFAPLRFCVPVFLTISIFLFEKKIANSPAESRKILFKKRLNRLGIPILFWFSVAIVLKAINGNSVLEIIASIFQGEIFTGAYYFLVILQLLWNFVLIRDWLNEENNILTAVIIQGVLLLFVYAVISGFFIDEVLAFLVFLERPLIIYWLAYMALGLYIYQNFDWIERISHSLSKPSKVLILCLTAATMISEYRILTLFLVDSLRPFDYAAFSCILSVPIMFICFASLNEKSFSLPIVKLIKMLSKYSLGIFFINGILAQIFFSIGNRLFSQASFNIFEILVIKIIGWIGLLGLSLLLSILLEKLGLKKMVC
ncbi:MAG: acyltransferase, partial [Rivularia sp. ALOHA_DT_140]|nr:acyltransferase [Rivularia sp. ALOHA_DT_140]